MTQSGCSLRRSVASIKAAIFLTTLVHSTLIPAIVMIGHHFSISDF
jgi:hypothetical protein